MVLIAALLWCLPRARADAQDDIEQVRVTAKRVEETLPESLARYGTRLDTISRTQVVDGGYVDVAGTLKTLAPGLYIQPKNGPFDYADISLLGSRSEDVLWLVDGVRINNPPLWDDSAPRYAASSDDRKG